MARLRESRKIRYMFEEQSFSNDFYHKETKILDIQAGKYLGMVK
jgi:hypothetical protein